jgi:hypothetical protein
MFMQFGAFKEITSMLVSPTILKEEFTNIILDGTRLLSSFCSDLVGMF